MQLQLYTIYIGFQLEQCITFKILLLAADKAQTGEGPK